MDLIWVWLLDWFANGFVLFICFCFFFSAKWFNVYIIHASCLCMCVDCFLASCVYAFFFLCIYIYTCCLIVLCFVLVDWRLVQLVHLMDLKALVLETRRPLCPGEWVGWQVSKSWNGDGWPFVFFDDDDDDDDYDDDDYDDDFGMMMKIMMMMMMMMMMLMMMMTTTTTTTTMMMMMMMAMTMMMMMMTMGWWWWWWWW